MDINKLADSCREILKDQPNFTGIEVWNNNIQFTHTECSKYGYIAYNVIVGDGPVIKVGLSAHDYDELDTTGKDVSEWCLEIWNDFNENYLDRKLRMFAEFARYGTN
jgi:hypothetical protein